MFEENQKIFNFVRIISETANRLSGIAVVLMIVLIVTEILLRKLFNMSTTICDEYTGYFQATIIFMALSQCYRENRHINVDLILNRLPNTLRHRLEIINNFIALIFVLLLLVTGWYLAWTSYQYGSTSYGTSNTPMFVPQSVIVIGLFIFSIQIILELILAIFSRRKEK